MGRRDGVRVLRRGVVALAAATVLVACRKDRAPTVEAPPPAPAPEAVAPPPPSDHLAPDELVEGDKKAFGLALPRVMRLDGAFVDVVMASGEVGVHPLVKYFQARLRDGSLHEGDESATFDHVHIPGRPGAEYTVRVWISGRSTRVEVRDTTPKPVPNLPDDAARWRQAGLTPEGRPLDPAHFE